MIALCVLTFVLFSTISADKSACLSPKLIGPCKGAMLRYYYNEQTGSCEAFLYGGCFGNANNFMTMDSCKNTCGETPIPVSVCTLPKFVGPCDPTIQRFYFNSLTGQCEMFLWGGCLGNENNFENLAKCRSTCMS